MEKQLFHAYDLLNRLGVTSNYKGFSYTAYAMALCAQRPDLLQLVTKNLYPEVARQYRTTWTAVERNIRTVAAIAWKQNPALLDQIAGCFLDKQPRSAQFISITSAALRRSRAQ